MAATRRASKAKETKDELAARLLKERLIQLASKIEGVEPKMMAGYRYFFLNGHGVAGLMGAKALFYLDEAASADFLAMPSTYRWMRDARDPGIGWHVLQEASACDDTMLDGWLRRAVSFVTTLPPTLKKPVKPRAKRK